MFEDVSEQGARGFAERMSIQVQQCFRGEGIGKGIQPLISHAEVEITQCFGQHLERTVLERGVSCVPHTSAFSSSKRRESSTLIVLGKSR